MKPALLSLIMLAICSTAFAQSSGGPGSGGSGQTSDYQNALMKQQECNNTKTFVGQSKAATASTKTGTLQAYNSAMNARSLCTDPDALAAGDELLNTGHVHYDAGVNCEDQAGVEEWVGNISKDNGDWCMGEWEYANAIYQYENAIVCYNDALQWHSGARSGYQTAQQKYDAARVAYLSP